MLSLQELVIVVDGLKKELGEVKNLLEDLVRSRKEHKKSISTSEVNPLEDLVKTLTLHKNTQRETIRNLMVELEELKKPKIKTSDSQVLKDVESKRDYNLSTRLTEITNTLTKAIAELQEKNLLIEDLRQQCIVKDNVIEILNR